MSEKKGSSRRFPLRNENCLAGRKCTGCGSLGPFQIFTSAYIIWTDDGTGDGHGFRFTEEAKARCEVCRLSGTVQEILPAPNSITCDDPDCTSDRFTATAKVIMNYLVDGDGDWVADGEESETGDLDYDSLICDACGEDATLR